METVSIDSNTIVQLGVGSAIVYIVLRLVLDFLKPILEKQFNIGTMPQLMSACKELAGKIDCSREEMLAVKDQVKALYVWHDQRNQDGVPLWYVPSSLEKAIESLAENVRQQTEVLRSVAEFQKDTVRFMDRLERRLERNGR